MEMLIEQFVSTNFCSCYGKGNSNVFFGNGYGNGNGSGSGYGIVTGSGSGGDYGFGCGCGNGAGIGNGSGYGNGNIISFCKGSGSGFGFRSGDGKDIKKIDNVYIYDIDNIPTGIISVHGNVAKGFTLRKTVIKVPCYIVKENNKFAHGTTLHEAYAALQEKLYDDSTEEERMQAFKEKFPEFDVPYSNRDLFVYHHILTGSCKFGRQLFIDAHNIDLDGKTSVKEFIALTKNEYRGEIIKQVKNYYI